MAEQVSTAFILAGGIAGIAMGLYGLAPAFFRRRLYQALGSPSQGLLDAAAPAWEIAPYPDFEERRPPQQRLFGLPPKQPASPSAAPRRRSAPIRFVATILCVPLAPVRALRRRLGRGQDLPEESTWDAWDDLDDGEPAEPYAAFETPLPPEQRLFGLPNAWRTATPLAPETAVAAPRPRPALHEEPDEAISDEPDLMTVSLPPALEASGLDEDQEVLELFTEVLKGARTKISTAQAVAAALDLAQVQIGDLLVDARWTALALGARRNEVRAR